MGLASVLHELGRLKEEADAYDRLLAFDPRSLDAWIDKGAVVHEWQDYAGAIRCYEEVLALRPEYAAAWNNKGAALLRLGHEADATRCFEEALQFDPDCVDAMANQTYLYEKQGYHGEAVLWADRALRIREAPGLWYAKGLAHLGLLESTLAIRSLDRALALDPTLNEATAALRRATAIRLDAPGPWVGLGQAQVAGGFLNEAAKSFDRAIQMGDTSALLNRAEALGAGGDYDLAIAACESYLASHPTDLRALAMKADFLVRSGFKEEAARILLVAADSHPEFPFLHAGAGTVFLRAGRPEVALEAFGPTPHMEASAIEGALNHGAAFLLLGRTREAIDIFQKALEKAPERGEALNNLGVAYLQMDEPKLAASNLARAAKHLDSARIRANLEKVPKAPPRPRAKKPAARKKPDP